MKAVTIHKRFFGAFAFTFSIITFLLSSCSTFKSSPTPEYVIDPVCDMKIDKSVAYTYKYKGVSYFFDSKNCKEAFKMNPEKFLK